MEIAVGPPGVPLKKEAIPFLKECVPIMEISMP
jgi:hypothetical protein